MHEFNILMEIEAPDGQTAQGDMISVVNKIKNYLIVIQFPRGESPSNAKITNVEQYGWGGIVVNNYQEAQSALEKVKNDNGKAKNIVLHSHGGATRIENEDGDLIGRREFISTSHIAKRDMREEYFTMLRRLSEGIPAEEEEKEKYYKERENERKKRAELRELNKAIREGTANLSKDEIKKLKQAKKWNNKDNNTNGYYDDLREKDEDTNAIKSDKDEYITFKEKIAKEKAKIEKTVTPEVKKDMDSLKSMISCVEDGGYFIFAACNSAYYTNTIQEIRKYVNLKINLVGIKYLANYNTKEGTDGELDGNVLFSQGLDVYLVKTSDGNKAISISPDGTEAQFSNIKIEKDGPKLIN